jgi:hypothetical protein
MVIAGKAGERPGRVSAAPLRATAGIGAVRLCLGRSRSGLFSELAASGFTDLERAFVRHLSRKVADAAMMELEAWLQQTLDAFSICLLTVSPTLPPNPNVSGWHVLLGPPAYTGHYRRYWDARSALWREHPDSFRADTPQNAACERFAYGGKAD